jgi:hypothetical protein
MSDRANLHRFAINQGPDIQPFDGAVEVQHKVRFAVKNCPRQHQNTAHGGRRTAPRTQTPAVVLIPKTRRVFPSNGSHRAYAMLVYRILAASYEGGSAQSLGNRLCTAQFYSRQRIGCLDPGQGTPPSEPHLGAGTPFAYLRGGSVYSDVVIIAGFRSEKRS